MRYLSLYAMGFALAAILACGGDGHGDLTGPVPSGPPDPSTPSDPPASAEAPVGWSIYAVDLTNHFLLFGSESPDVLTRKAKIKGLPILNRIIGIAFRPKDGKLYGVGNDSRVYTIDTLTAVASPVSETPFSPDIAEMFDIHFAMALEPNGDRVRLFAAESGGNWSISLDDGTATMGAKAHYADSSAFAGQIPALMGIVYAPKQAAGSLRFGASRVSLAAMPGASCEDLMYAIDADRGMILNICDPDTGEYAPVGDLPKDEYARCGEMLFTPPSDGAPGDPGTGSGSDLPPGPLSWGYDVTVMMMQKVQNTETWLNNVVGKINPDGSFSRAGSVPADPIQTADSDFKVGGKYGPRRSPVSPKVMGSGSPAGAAAAATGEPTVHCTRPS